MLNTGDIKKEIDVAEEYVFKLDIITSFEHRGWGLYKCSNGGFVDSISDINNIIYDGRAKDDIEYGVPYILLPLVDNDADYELIRELTHKIISEGRGPYFVDLLEGEDEEGRWIETVGVYLVDSIVIDPPFIYLVIDRRMSKTRIPYKDISDSIEIHLTDLYKIRKQLMASVRG